MVTQEEFASSLAPEIASLNLNSASFSSDALKKIIDLVRTFSQMPSKEVVLSGVEKVFDDQFGGKSTPLQDNLIEPMMKYALLMLVGYAYDALSRE